MIKQRFSLSIAKNNLSVFYFTKKVLLLFCTLYVIALASCSNKIRISEYAKYNRIDKNWFQTFINDSLQFSIDFFGRNTFTPFANSSKYKVSKSNIAILKALQIRRNARILLYLKPGIKRYGQASYGYLIDRSLLKLDTGTAVISKTKQGDEFFTLKRVFKNGNETSLVGGTEIKNKYFILIESQLESAEFEPYTQVQLLNTTSQLSLVLKGEHTISYLVARKKISNAIDSSYYSLDYFKTLSGLREIQQDTVLHYNLDNFYFQDVLTRISFFDNLDSTHQYFEQYRNPATTVNPANKFAISGDAIDKVFEIAKTQKMMMINENHYDYRHRLFVNLLLDSLYKIGYRNFCVEALRNDVKNSYISKKNGFYVSEPFMASVIRRAKEIGFNVYGYDTSAPSTQQREMGEAKNLYNLYKKDPDHKWVVLAGYSHVNKRFFSAESKSALQFFSALAGFTPFSINQSDLSDITDQRYTVPGNRVGYYAVDTSSFIYRNKQSDLYVINNIKSHPFEVPFPSIKPYLDDYEVEVPANSAELNLFIYEKKEYDALRDLAVPVYIGKAGNDQLKKLHLPANDYVSVILDDYGNEVAKVKIIKHPVGEAVSSTNK